MHRQANAQADRHFHSYEKKKKNPKDFTDFVHVFRFNAWKFALVYLNICMQLIQISSVKTMFIWNLFGCSNSHPNFSVSIRFVYWNYEFYFIFICIKVLISVSTQMITFSFSPFFLSFSLFEHIFLFIYEIKNFNGNSLMAHMNTLKGPLWLIFIFVFRITTLIQ